MACRGASVGGVQGGVLEDEQVDGGEHEDGGNGESDHLGVAEEWVDTEPRVCSWPDRY